MASKSNIAERRARAIISIDESIQILNGGNLDLVQPVRTNDGEMKSLLQLEAIAANLKAIAESGSQESDELPEDFPYRGRLIEQEITLPKVKSMTRDELIELKYIKDEAADKILEYLKNA